ncbi:hypothetical protein BN1723_008563 [Verticillium longisporum]|uniref:Uncharacterized protein n=1 Tax=Verticillium longisporum TaxID=100787 RepID=A0A0G4KGR9_VERLO|nr:hypothetical protein BN1723_008563 [Verticillium longisporum]
MMCFSVFDQFATSCHDRISCAYRQGRKIPLHCEVRFQFESPKTPTWCESQSAWSSDGTTTWGAGWRVYRLEPRPTILGRLASPLSDSPAQNLLLPGVFPTRASR